MNSEDSTVDSHSLPAEAAAAATNQKQNHRQKSTSISSSSSSNGKRSQHSAASSSRSSLAYPAAAAVDQEEEEMSASSSSVELDRLVPNWRTTGTSMEPQVLPRGDVRRLSIQPNRQQQQQQQQQRRLSRMSSGDEELRQRIWELTAATATAAGAGDDGREEKAGGEGGEMGRGSGDREESERESARRRSEVATVVAPPPYPFWNSNEVPANIEFESWLTGGTSPVPGQRQMSVEDGGAIGWQMLPPPLPTSASASLFDDHWGLLFPKASEIPPLDLTGGKKVPRPAETTYRATFTPKLAPKPRRARGPPDNFALGPGSGGGSDIAGLGIFPATMESSTTNGTAFPPPLDNNHRTAGESWWLQDRSVNCRAKKALGHVHSGRQRDGHVYFDCPSIWNGKY